MGTLGFHSKIVYFGGFILVFLLIISINKSQGVVRNQINSDVDLSTQRQSEGEKSLVDQFTDSEYMDPFYELEYMNSKDYVAGKSSNPIDFEIRKNYITHDTIEIDSNADFETLGFPGSGTEADPYIIEGYIIEGNSSIESEYAPPISIRDITSFFEIRNNYLSSVEEGITLTHTTNGFIYNNTVIVASTGIYFDHSFNNTITSNFIANNTFAGIFLSNSPYNIINNNILENSGLGLYGGLPYGGQGGSIDDVVQTKVENNTINGFPLIFLQHVNNYVIPGDVGQIILINCTYIEINNKNIMNTSNAIQIIFSSFTTISSNTIANSTFAGILIHYSSDNIITSNVISNQSRNGILLASSSFNFISSNTMLNSLDGIGLYSSSNNIVSSNVISYNSRDGFKLYNSFNNILSSNNIYNNFGEGISLFVIEPLDFGPPVPYSYNNTIISNIIANNGGAGIEFNYSRDNYIISNIISNNSGNGIEFNGATGNTATSNIISENSGYGFYIDASSYYPNSIKYNNFIDNYLQSASQAYDKSAYDKSSNDNFKFNYWSDQTGPDIDNNGLVDDPYELDGLTSNFDYYPLTIPVGEVVRLPSIDNPEDVFYKEGSDGNIITWNAIDTNPSEYYVTLDRKLYHGLSFWLQGPIDIYVDGFDPGVHIVIINVFNIYGNKISDSVVVTVEDVTINEKPPSTSRLNPENTDSTTSLTRSPFSFVLPFPILIVHYFKRKIKVNRTIYS